MDHHIIADSELIQYPWCCIGRVEASPPGDTTFHHAGTGTLVGPNMVLTAAHVLEDRALNDGWRFRFIPAYKNGPQKRDPAGGSLTTGYFTGRFITGNPSGDPSSSGLSNNVNGWDFVICELTQNLGDTWGHLGVYSSNSKFYKANRWTSVGYPVGLGGKNPFRFPGIDISDVDNDKFNTKEIETDDYVFEDLLVPADQRAALGWSGGPLLGVIEGSWWVVGVMSGQEPDGVFDLVNGVNVFAGGRRLIDVHQQAHRDWLPLTPPSPPPPPPAPNTGPERYNAVWVQNNDSWQYLYGWAREHFDGRAAELQAQGYRLMDLNAFVLPNGQGERFNAVWIKNNEDRTAVWGWAREHFDGRAAELQAQGYRLMMLNAFVLPEGERFNAIWARNNEDRTAVWGWAREHFDGRAAELQAQGYRLMDLNAFVLPNGQGERFNAIWARNNEDRTAVWGWAREHFDGRVAELEAQGYHPIELNAFVLL